MPEMNFVLRWPDGTYQRCYSPSLVVRDYLEVGRSYPLSEIVERSRTMLRIASDRVEEKYGFHCSAATDQLAEIEERASICGADAMVTVVGFDVPDDSSRIAESRG
ncbi:MAG: MSMEG_0570 family nitrogen starvation response protein [Myxococcota bacterium]|nr:MSMEG_0570 family nitrogen starvation response protein [Myxococcota bacterium]